LSLYIRLSIQPKMTAATIWGMTMKKLNTPT
jgi:hypothetical protein